MHSAWTIKSQYLVSFRYMYNSRNIALTLVFFHIRCTYLNFTIIFPKLPRELQSTVQCIQNCNLRICMALTVCEISQPSFILHSVHPRRALQPAFLCTITKVQIIYMFAIILFPQALHLKDSQVLDYLLACTVL